MSPLARALSTIGLGGALASCSAALGPDEGAPTEVALKEPPQSERGAPDRAAPPRTRREEPSGFTLSGEPERRLGAPCQPARSPDAGSVEAGSVDPCGSRSRIAMQVEPTTHRLRGEGSKLPCEPRALGKPSGYAESACVADGYLVAVSSCVMCRVPDAGTVVLARVDELTGAQNGYVHRLLRLAGEVPTGSAGWQSALDRARP